MPGTKNPVEEIEVDLSQLFVGATCEEGPSENAEFLPITEGAIKNWTADYLPLEGNFSKFEGISDTEEEFESISRDLKQYEEKPKPNLEETEIINIGTKTETEEVKVSIHLNRKQKEEMIEFLMLFQDVFAWSYDDMPGISTDIVVHMLPTDPNFLPVKQKPRKFKPEMNLKIKEQIVKQLNAKIIMVSHYPIWLSNLVPVPKKSGEVRSDAFRLKNAGATYQRTMTTLFHDMIHKEMEVYVDDIIIKSKKVEDHFVDLKKLFERSRKYNLKLNPAKCAFGAPAGKLLGFIVSKKGIEIDPAKIKTIRDMPIPKCQKDVKSFLGKINFIGRFIAQLTSTCEPLFKLLKKNAPMDWNEDCQ
ncbi:uncharacterized protein [Coffea arabica]|uniref:Reverse transcriptase domain-containing protein n=1 Tax=Coffea arabica TaxID=13443 RepID=A0ABM4WD05_COFAR